MSESPKKRKEPDLLHINAENNAVAKKLKRAISTAFVQDGENNSGAPASILLPYGEVLSDSVTVLRKSDLEFGEVAADSMDAIYGLGDMKRLLRECISLPLNSPKHYKISPKFLGGEQPDAAEMGKRDLERTLAFYGQRGTGKMLLIYTFGLVEDLTIIVINYAGFLPDRDIKIAYEYAETHMPCVVVFDECEGAFHPHAGAVDRNVGILQHWLDKVERSNAPIWTVFISSVIPNLNNVHFAIHKFISHSCWSGELTAAEREKAFHAAINHYLYPGQESPLHENDMMAYVRMSIHCTVGNIFSFIKRVFLYRAKQAGDAQAMMSQTDDSLIPTLEDFSLHIVRPGGVGRDRITDFDPATYNISPYSNTVQGDPNDAPHGF